MSTSRLTERQYRQIERDSYSSLSLFSSDRKAYYRKYILKERFEEKLTPQLIYGSLVDCLLFTPSEFEDRFIVGTFSKPRPLMEEFTKNLVKRAIENGSEEKFENLMLWAYNDTKYDGLGNEVAFKKQSFDSVKEEFKSCTAYYDFLIDTIVAGKILITTEEYDKAKIAVNTLTINPTTGSILNEGEQYRQLVILFELDGLPMKSMLDLVIVDHDQQIIQPYDLKTTHNAEHFPTSYLKFNYYIQSLVYHEAAVRWAEEKGIGHYNVLPMRFMVMDSYNYMEPLIYVTDHQQLYDSYNGFIVNGRRYKGVKQLISDLRWHKENDVWTISKDNYKSSRIVKLILEENEEGESQSTA